MEEKHFSIVVRPAKHVIDAVADLKNLLARTGNFGSRNAEAHITVLEFFARDEQLPAIYRCMREFAALSPNYMYRFDHVASFPEMNTRENGILYLAPNSNSAARLTELSSTFHERFPLKGKVRAIPSGNPHITIGRRLRQSRLDEALELFSSLNLDMKFEATLALRVKGVNVAEQFQLVTEFAFSGAPHDNVGFNSAVG
ncbi:MAG: 2'-5' RNA ligase family protein [Proteobacteria bacterium]|nr:MAG: 2'-5' RNA ligase family protein [Pseudomonadota bacterium]